KCVTFLLTVGRDIRAQVSDITSGTDCILGGLGEANWSALLPAYAQSGAHLKLFGPQGNLDQKVVTPFPKQTEGAIIAGIYPDLSDPVWKDFRAALTHSHA